MALYERDADIGAHHAYALGFVTMPLYYHGFTKVDPKAVLQIGDGTKGKKIDQYRFYNNGTLIVANAKGAISGVGALTLSDISGRVTCNSAGPPPSPCCRI